MSIDSLTFGAWQSTVRRAGALMSTEIFQMPKLQFKLFSIAVAGLVLALKPAVADDKTFELKLSDWLPPSHPLQKSIEEWASLVERESNGTLKYRIYPAQQLGKAFDHYDMARDGIADLAYVSPGYQPGRFAIFEAANLPFMLPNAKAGSGALDMWYRKYAPSEMRDVKFCFAFAHDPGTFHSRAKKILVPTDIANMKIRPAHATMASLVTQLGEPTYKPRRQRFAMPWKRG